MWLHGSKYYKFSTYDKEQFGVLDFIIFYKKSIPPSAICCESECTHIDRKPDFEFYI